MRFEKEGGKFVKKLTLTQRQIRVCPDKFKGRSKNFLCGVVWKRTWQVVHHPHPTFNADQAGRHFQTTFYRRRASHASINKKPNTIGAKLCTPLQN